MTRPTWPGATGLFRRRLAGFGALLLALVLQQPMTAAAAPHKAPTTGAKTARTQQAGTASSKPTRAASRKTASSTPASKKPTRTTRTTRKHVAPACPKATSTSTTKGKTSKTTKGRKTPPTAGCKRGPSTTAPAAVVGGASGGAAAATAAAPPTPIPQEPERPGIRLPLMLRTVPSLPDNPEALQARLDSIVAAQGASAQGAQVSGVRQLAPDIYAFSLQCADAEQCQRLRLAIEQEIDWVAGLQLDERRHLPPPPERSAPAAR